MTVGLLARPSTGARIAGLGGARPDHVVDAAMLTAPFGKTAEWLRVRTGIQRVRRLRAGESVLDLAVTAAERALADAGVAARDVDVVLVASCSTPAGPTGAPLSRRVADALAPRAVAFDVNAACAGFCYALSAARGLVGRGEARTVLVVGAEQMSRLVDPEDLGTSILFGDGAGAAVVVASAQDGIAAPAWSSDGAQAGVLVVPPGRTAMRMNGSAVFRWAVAEVHKVAREALTRAGVRAEQIDVFVPHQANLRIVEAITERAGLQGAVVAGDVAVSGNTSAASIPLALDALRRGGLDTRGKTALLTGFGAGLAVAAQVVLLP